MPSQTELLHRVDKTFKVENYADVKIEARRQGWRRSKQSKENDLR